MNNIVMERIIASTFYEPFNLENAIIIIQNFNEIIKQLTPERQKKIEEKRKEYDFLLSLKKICKNSNGIISTTYKPSKQLKTQGRLFAQNASLQSLPREFRGCLASGLLYDIDINNAHPVLLQQYCEKNGIRCDNLKYYCNNRDEILNEIMIEYDYTRDEAKNLFLRTLNGGFRDGITNQFYIEFKKELKEIHNLITLKNENIYKSLKKRKEFNIEGSVTNVILCNLENLVITTTYEFLILNDYDVCVLVFDGLMIKQKNDIYIPFPIEILENMSKYIYNKTGYKVNFSEKPLDNTIDLSLISNKINEMKVDLSNKTIINDDVEARDYILKHHGHKYICCNKIKYVKVNHLWSSHQSDIKKVITNDIINSDLWMPTKSSVKKYSGSASSINSCLNLILNTGFTDDDTFIVKNKQKAINYLPFQDCVYSFIDKKTYEYNELDIAFFNDTFRKFPKSSNEFHKQRLMKFIDAIYPNETQRDYNYHLMARALAGCNDKIWIKKVGERNCGKSKETSLMENAFGSFVDIFDAKCLINTKHNTSSETALSWVVEIKDARVAISNEIKANEGSTLNGNFIKQLSGGDTIRCRKLNENNEKFKVGFNIVLNCNQEYKTDPIDAMENAIILNYETKFVDEEDLIEGIAYYKLKDNGVNTLIYEDEIIDEYILFVISHFNKDLLPKPEIIKISTEMSYEEDEGHKLSKFLATHFKMTNNKEDKYWSSQLLEIVNENGFHLSSPIRITKLLTSLKIGIYNEKTVIGGEKHRGFTFIKYSPPISV
jgi:hypothetical protein